VFLLAPVLYFVAFALYLDASRSVYLAEEYIQRVVTNTFAQRWQGDHFPAWYWERFASGGRRNFYMTIVGGLKVGAAFVVPTVGSLFAFWHFHSSPWTWYERLLFWTDVAAIALLVLVAQMIHHIGRPLTSPDETLTWWQKLGRFFW
jgi:hypothetical protein